VAATIPASGIAAAVSTPVTGGESPQALAPAAGEANRAAMAPEIERRRRGHATDLAAERSPQPRNATVRGRMVVRAEWVARAGVSDDDGGLVSAQHAAERDQTTPANGAGRADPESEPASTVTRTDPANHSVDGGSQPPASEDAQPDRPAAPPRANGQGKPATTDDRIPRHANGQGKPATTGERIPPHASGEDRPAEATEPGASSPPTRPEQPQGPPKAPPAATPAGPPAARATPNPTPTNPGAAGDGRPDSKRPSGGGG
jgi:hypothetical protein